MAPNGNIISYAYTSAGRIPLAEVAIRILRSDTASEELLSIQMTDKDGKTASFSVDTPSAVSSLTPGNETPFASVIMTAELPGYEQIRVENVQIFPGVETVQNFRMIPLRSGADVFTAEEVFTIPPQNL